MISLDEACPHQWVDVTAVNAKGAEFVCAECGSGMCPPHPFPAIVQRVELITFYPDGTESSGHIETISDVSPGWGYAD
jgi:hypothetical protein